MWAAWTCGLPGHRSSWLRSRACGASKHVLRVPWLHRVSVQVDLKDKWRNLMRQGVVSEEDAGSAMPADGSPVDPYAQYPAEGHMVQVPNSLKREGYVWAQSVAKESNHSMDTCSVA